MSQGLDICIRGGGVVGRSLALLLARERLRVGLLEQPDAQGAAADVRAYALNPASRDLLLGLRAWPEDPASVTAVLRLQVWGDQGSELSFDADALGAEAMSWIVDVAALEAQLGQAVRYQAQIEMLSAPAPARLNVICEGRASDTRAELGVEFEVTPYAQQAVAMRLRCEQAHAQVARQWFGADGDILAFLPLGGAQGNSVAVVWSVAPARAAQLMQMEPELLCQELLQASQAALGGLTLVGQRRCWPLQKAQARQWSGRSELGAWVLAGDAAHNVHPLAGLGLNLGLADAATLSQVLRQREYWRAVDDLRLLRRYERTRKAGLLPLSAGLDGLQLLFTREGAGWSTLRNWGLRGVQRSGWLKHLLARQAMIF